MANEKKTAKEALQKILSRGYTAAKGTVDMKRVAEWIAEKHPAGKVWNKIPKKQKDQITKLLSRGYEAAKKATKGKIKKQYGGSVRKAKY